jgi:hypothetical protein
LPTSSRSPRSRPRPKSAGWPPSGYRETYGFALAKFFSDPVWWFYLTWLTLYFKNERGLTLTEIGWALPVIYLMADFGSVMGGWVSGYLMRRGWPHAKARKATMGFFALCMPVAATAVIAPNIILTVLLISSPRPRTRGGPRTSSPRFQTYSRNRRWPASRASAGSWAAWAT